MKAISVCFIALAMTLYGCVIATPVNLQADPETRAIEAFATLSDSANPADMAASAVYTRLAVYRRLAAKKLRGGEISVDYARFVQREANRIRRELDHAVSMRDLSSIKEWSGVLATDQINLELRHAH